MFLRASLITTEFGLHTLWQNMEPASQPAHINYLARTMSPPLLAPAAEQHGHLTYSTFLQILSLQFISEAQWGQAVLPIKLGGFGLTPMSQVAPAAYIFSWVHSINTIPDQLPHLRGSPQLLLSVHASRRNHLDDTIQTYQHAVSGTGQPPSL
jgi:hypothetical protein